jgi:hypothetical protein
MFLFIIPSATKQDPNKDIAGDSLRGRRGGNVALEPFREQPPWRGRGEGEGRRSSMPTAAASLRLSATVTSKFFPLYHFFPLFSPLCFHLPQRFPLNTPPIPHYNYKISFSISTTNFLSTNNYSWPHNTVL